MLASQVSIADECLYNQDVYKEMYDGLRNKYKHTEYQKKDKSLEITLEDSKIIVWYGGCEHYGTKIRYFENKKKVYSKREIFDKSVHLVTLFARHMINPSELKAILSSGKYKEIEKGSFLVDYPTMDWFSITVGGRAGKPLIDIDFYN